MRRIQSNVDVRSDTFRANRDQNRALIATLRRRQEEVRARRPERDLERLARQGKLFVRDRLALLLDPGTPFLELSTLAANMAYDGEVPGAGQVTGIGIVSGREVIMHADDASVKGGAWYPLSVKKIVRTLDIAIENRLPVVHICDSAGGFLPLQAELFADRYYAGRIFRNQCTLSKMGVPQVAIVARPLHGRRRLHPGAQRLLVIVRGTGAIFLGGPPLVKAATGEVVTADELGGADVHTQRERHGGLPSRVRAGGDRHRARHRRPARARRRRPRSTATSRSRRSYDPEELYGIIPRRHEDPVRHARGHRPPRRRQPLPRVPAGLRHHAGLRLRAPLGLQGRHPRQQRRALQRQLAQGRALHGALRTRTARRCCSCRTSPATWSAASTKRAASPRTAPR